MTGVFLAVSEFSPHQVHGTCESFTQRAVRCFYVWRMKPPCQSDADDSSMSSVHAGHLPDVLRKIKVGKSLKGILFDVDGTLAHSDDLHYQAFVDMLQKEGFQGVVECCLALSWVCHAMQLSLRP